MENFLKRKLWQKAIEVSFDASSPHPYQSDKKKSVTIMDGLESHTHTLSLSHTHFLHTHFSSAKCHLKWKKNLTKRHLDSLSLWEQFSPLFPIKTRWHQPNCCRKRSCNYCRNKSRDLGTRTHIRIDRKKFSRKIIVHCKIIGQRLQFNAVPKLWTMRLQTHARTLTHQIIREQFALCNILMLSVLFSFKITEDEEAIYMEYKLRQRNLISGRCCCWQTWNVQLISIGRA